MLCVPTFQVRHPILRFILMKTNDLALHRYLMCDSNPTDAWRSWVYWSPTSRDKESC